jgi:hypothetical protein
VLFDERERYFAADTGGYYQQGDIILAPVAVLEAYGPTSGPARRSGIGVPIVTEVWNEAPLGRESNQLVSNIRLCPALITTHDCTLDKDFNRQVEAFRAKQSMRLDAAETLAASDTSLDRYINIAPLIPLEDAAPSGAAELRRNDVIGYFPVCANADLGVDEGVIDLLRETTIDRDLIVVRLAVLSPDARRALRYALARYWVFRAPKIGFELEDAIGKRIKDVTTSQDGTLAVELLLSDGSRLKLVQPPGDTEGGPERPGLPMAGT